MAKQGTASATKRLSRTDWLKTALETVSTRGVQHVKVSVLASELGVTSGSFYWHFENRQELLHELLEGWERDLTDAAIIEAREFTGPPEARIRTLMERVVADRLARYDIAIWHWALSDRQAARVYRRAVKKRFEFARWMFEQAGFPMEVAAARGRMMVVYLMGEATLIPTPMREPKQSLRVVFATLMAQDFPSGE